MKRMLELHAVVHEYIHRSSKERVGAYKNSLTRELTIIDDELRLCREETSAGHIRSSHNLLTFFQAMSIVMAHRPVRYRPVQHVADYTLVVV